MLATSWNILSGYSGYISFGHGAFFGAGVYTTAALARALRRAVPLDAAGRAALIAAAAGARHSALVVFRVRRVRGELFALLTLAVTFVLGDDHSQHADRRRARRLPRARCRCRGSGPSAAVDRSTCSRSRWRSATAGDRVRWSCRVAKLGAGLFAIHDDEDVAEVMGVPTYRCKLAAFALSCALAGMAGGIHALFVSYVTVGENVLDHSAADGRADERARRHAPLGRDRRSAPRSITALHVRVHRERLRDRRQGDRSA